MLATGVRASSSFPALQQPNPTVVVLGDSIAEGDSFVQNVKSQLADSLGDRGPGFFSMWSGAWVLTGPWKGEPTYGPFGSAFSGTDGAFAELTVFHESDTLNVLYVCTPDSTPFSFMVDNIPHPVGGACTTPTFMKATIHRGNVGWHFVRVAIPKGGKAYLWGLSAEIGTRGILVENVSNPGHRIIEAGASLDALRFLDVLAPTLTIVALGMNDIASSVPLDQYETCLSRIVAYASRFGAVILISENPRIDENTLSPQQSVYHAINERVAKAAGIMHLDMFDRWGSYTAASAKGLIRSDGYHPSAAGQIDYATALWEQLARPAVRSRMR